MSGKAPTAKKRRMHEGTAVIKPTAEIKLDRMLAAREVISKAKADKITLKEFIREQYHFGLSDSSITAFKCTIEDIGLAPFAIDVYDTRIIVVEVTGKTRKDFDGNEVPERLYRGRFNNMSSTLKYIADVMSMRKIMGGESTVITLREYHNAYFSFQKYIAGIVSKDYAKALDAMQEKFPFTQISEGRDDEEDWFH